MREIAFSLLLLLSLSISTNCASAAEKNGIAIEAPPSGVAGEKITLKAQTDEPLPASSFYRVEIECPGRPEGGEVAVEAGYPASDLVFGKAGKYSCVVSLGILTKSSCAGVQYKALGEREFNIEILPK